MKHPILFILLATLLLSVSCEKEKGNGAIQCTTYDAHRLSASSYELTGSVKIAGEDVTSGETFFYYSSTGSGISELVEKGTKVRAGSISTQNQDFKATISNLKYGTSYYYLAAVQVLGEVVTGSVKSFTTEDKPVLASSTGDATDITETSATLYGYSSLPRTELGSSTVGFIYSTSSEPTQSNGKLKSTKEFLSDTQFVASISGLVPDTKYYFRSFLLQNGTYLYGSVSSFTTAKINAKVTTNGAQNVSEHSATISGALSLTSLSILSTSVALYYSDKYSAKEDIFTKGTKVSLTASQDGNFSKDLTNLPHSTSYSYFAYARIEGVDFFGEVVQFKTSDINASLQTGDASEISEHKAMINGSFELISEISKSPTVCFYYSDNFSDKESLKASGKRINVSSIPSNGKFSSSLSNLTHSTTYYYMVFAQVEDVEFFGEVRSFNTLAINASVTTGDASGISEHKAKIAGKFIRNTVEQIAANVALYYSPTISDRAALVQNGKKIPITSIGTDGTFNYDLTGLTHSTKYYYMAYAKLEDVEFFGDVESFSTRTISATVTTGNATSISEHKAILSGTFSLNSIETLKSDVSILYSSSAKTASALKASGTSCKISDISSSGQFSLSLKNLAHSTTYYYMVTATVEGVVFDGTVKSFSTATVNASVSTGEATEIKYHDATLKGNYAINTIESLDYSVGFYFSNSANTSASLRQNGAKITSNTLSGSSFVCDAMGDADHRTYYYMAFLEIDGLEFLGTVRSFKMHDIPEDAIDLGLPLLWAKCNVGASSPGNVGNLYIWGPGISFSGPRYTVEENLIPEDDDATKTLGSHWRTPTKNEVKMLIDNCSIQLNYPLYGTSGVLITSKIQGFTNCSIFLPKNHNVSYSHIYAWTSTCVGGGNAYAMIIKTGGVFTIKEISKDYELPIRPVYND